MKGRTSMGRQKIDIKRIVDDEARQVTFSKRRLGLFKKASELCTLCGAEVAIIVFSPAGKAFSFGHPRVDSVVDRFFTGAPPDVADVTQQLLDAHRGATVRELNRHYTEISNQLDEEKKRGETLFKMKKAVQKERWWEAPVEELNLNELEQLKVSMEGLKKNIANRADEILIQASSSSSYFGGHPAGAIDPFPNNATLPTLPTTTAVPPYGFNFGYGNRFY